jgi:hypothetical protein
MSGIKVQDSPEEPVQGLEVSPVVPKDSAMAESSSEVATVRGADEPPKEGEVVGGAKETPKEQEVMGEAEDVSSNEEDEVVEKGKGSSDQEELLPIPPPVPKGGITILAHKLWIGNLDRRLTE